jgi:uncharacterized membrane protein
MQQSEVTSGFFCCQRPNRSLGLRGRVLWIALITLNAIVISIAAVLIGAWPIVPFAGLEVLLVGLAFWWIGRHDGDYESFSITAGVFSWERSIRGETQKLTGNAAWARVERSSKSSECPKICYGGVSMEMGVFLPSEARQRFAQSIEVALRLKHG